MNSNKNLIGLVIVNHNCNSSNLVDKYVNKILINHQSELLISKKKEDLENIINSQDYIVIFGGDGTVFSTVQKIIDKNIAIVHFPNGTGNGLTNSLLYQSNLKIDTDLDKTYSYIYNRLDEFKYQDIDTMKISMINSKIDYYSFLFLSFGTFANLDINSDWLRILGEVRFTIGAIIELLLYIFRCKTVKAKLEYKNDDGNIIIEDGNFTFFLANNLSHTSGSSITSPLSKPNDGYIYLSYALQPCSSYKLVKILLGLEDGSYINELKYVRTKWFRITPYSNDDVFYDIDGEKFEIEPVEVNINPKSLKVLI